MRNYWLFEIRIKEAANLLSVLLTDEFKGEIPDFNKWTSLLADLIDIIYIGDIVVLNGLIRYQLGYELDEFGLINNMILLEI